MLIDVLDVKNKKQISRNMEYIMKKHVNVIWHTKKGIQLKRIRADLIKLHIDIGHVYPLRISNKLRKAHILVDQVRSLLENEMYKENPGIETRTDIYYGED